MTQLQVLFQLTIPLVLQPILCRTRVITGNFPHPAIRKIIFGGLLLCTLISGIEWSTEAAADSEKQSQHQALKNECFYVSLFDLLSIAEDIHNSLRQLHLLERYKGDKLTGYEVSHVASNSVFSQYGLKKNDLITALNHIPLSKGPLWAKEIRRIPQLPEFSIQVYRRGRATRLRYILDGNLQCNSHQTTQGMN